MANNNIIKFLSQERLNPYLKLTDNNLENAFQLYEYNILLSESFYIPLHIFEIVLRNTLHNSLSKKYGEKWYLDKKIQFGQNRKDDYIIKKLKEVERILIGKDKKYFYGTSLKEIKYYDIISNLNFGFWKCLLIYNRDNICWKPCLKHIFKKNDRRYFYHKLNEIINFRNRIFHHEKIFNRNLQENFNSIINIISIFSPYLAKRTKELSRFEKLYKEYLAFRKKQNSDAPISEV